MRYLLTGTVLLVSASLVSSQTTTNNGQTSSGGQLTTLVVSPNGGPNGASVNVRVLDNQQTTGINGDRQVVTATRSSREDEDDLDDQVVSGLLEWLDKKKKKKKEKKENKEKDKEKEKEKEKNEERPAPQEPSNPQEPPSKQEEKKEIHIHIHIEKKDKHKKGHKHGGGGHYEDYHEGHYDHDKHFQGKHSMPLLGHHFNWDHDFYSGNGFGGGSGSYGDDFGGFESNKVNNYVIEKQPIVVQRPVLVKKKKEN